MLARAKKTPIRHMTPDELKVHRERLRERRDALRAAARKKRYTDLGMEPPPERGMGRPLLVVLPIPVELEPGSRPRPEGKRRHDCRRYNACLHHAAAEGWDDFGCDNCQIVEPLTPEERVRDWGGLVALREASKGDEWIAAMFGIKTRWRRP